MHNNIKPYSQVKLKNEVRRYTQDDGMVTYEAPAVNYTKSPVEKMNTMPFPPEVTSYTDNNQGAYAPPNEREFATLSY